MANSFLFACRQLRLFNEFSLRGRAISRNLFSRDSLPLSSKDDCICPVTFSKYRSEQVEPLSGENWGGRIHRRGFATAVQRVLETPATQYQENTELDAIELDYSVRGRVDCDRYQDVIDQLKKSGAPISFEQSLVLLRCCGSAMVAVQAEDRSQLVEQTWDLLSSLGNKLTTEHFNALLSVWLENKHTFSVVDVLSRMESEPLNLSPDATTFQLILARYCSDGDADGASTILEHMKSKGFSINHDVFNSLVYCYSKRGDMTGVNNVLNAMTAASMRPNPTTYLNMALPFAEKGDVEKLKEIDEKAASGDYFGLNERDWFDLIFALSANGHSSKLSELLVMLPRKPASLFKAHETALRLILLGKYDDAIEVATTSVKEEINDDMADASVSYIVYTLLAMKSPIRVLHGFFDHLMKKGRLEKPYERALYSALRHHDPRNVFNIIKYMADHRGDNPKPCFFYPLLVDAVKEGDVANIASLVMRIHNDFSIGFTSWEATRFLYRPMPDSTVKEFLATVRREAKSRKQHQYVQRLVEFYGQGQGMPVEDGDGDAAMDYMNLDSLPLKDASSIDILLEQLQTAHSSGGHVKTVLKRLIMAYCYANDGQNASTYFDQLLACGAAPSSFIQELAQVLTSMEEPSVEMQQFTQQLMKHLDPSLRDKFNLLRRKLKMGQSLEAAADMPLNEPSTIKELECQLENSSTSGTNRKVILKRLVLACCSQNDGKKASTHFDQLLSSGAAPSAFMHELVHALTPMEDPSVEIQQFTRKLMKHLIPSLKAMVELARMKWTMGQSTEAMAGLPLKEPSTIKDLERQLENSSTSGTNRKVILKRLVHACCYQDDGQKASTYFDQLLASGAAPSAFMHELAQVFMSMEEPSVEMQQFTRKLKKHLDPTSWAKLDFVRRKWTKGQSPAATADLPLNEPSTIKDLECQLESSRTLGTNRKVILKRLVLACCYQNDGKKAENYFDELLFSGSTPSAFMSELVDAILSVERPTDEMNHMFRRVVRTMVRV